MGWGKEKNIYMSNFWDYTVISEDPKQKYIESYLVLSVESESAIILGIIIQDFKVETPMTCKWSMWGGQPWYRWIAAVNVIINS